jgi:hypothetical protein
MKQGVELRKSNTASEYYSESSIQIPAYKLISQRGDTISAEKMKGKVCVYEFYSEDCYQGRYAGQNPLFQLQEDYYGKTLSLRIISVNLTDSSKQNTELQHYSNRYAARETWHVTGGDTSTAQNIFSACTNLLTQKNITEQNFYCPKHVFLTDRNGNICGAYLINDEKQFSALFTDILFTIDRKE